MKKKVVLYGAYDRYNFGDNLMPILLKMYLEKYEREKFDEIELVYSSISRSDLGMYACLPTEAIGDVVRKLQQGDSIIVVGGEVLCATNATLFLHMPKPKRLNDFYTKLNRLPIINRLFKKWAELRYRAPWDYPYLPDFKMLGSGVGVCYNTVGGSLDYLPETDVVDLTARLRKANYVSARDSRTRRNLSEISGVELFPDSAFIMSDLCSEDFLSQRVRPDVLDYVSSDYLVFQAAPNKLGGSVELAVEKLKLIHESTQKRILLLPIGYAAGHDDLYLLNQIHEFTTGFSDVKGDLTIWEIMYLIKHGELYIGTSLHGAVAAMSFGKPHFGLNKDIKKLDSFLSDWSVGPYNRCYSLNEIDSLPALVDAENQAEIEKNASKIISQVKENNKRLFAAV